MKILVCTDGSAHSQKTLEKACEIAEQCKVDEVALIHVYEGRLDFPSHQVSGGRTFTLTDADSNYIKEQCMAQVEKGERMLKQALKVFEDKKIPARTILKQGQPSHTITGVAAEEGFDMIFIGSRGLGGLKKVFLGSVSSSVAHEAQNCMVVIVK